MASAREPMPSEWTEFRRGWMALLAAFVGNALSVGTLAFYSLGVLTRPLHHELGWDSAAIEGALLAITLCTLLVSPFVGGIIDRRGVRQVATASAALSALSFCLFALLRLTLPLYYLLWVVVAAAGAGCFPMTWSRLVNQHFRAKRGLALGISFTGTGLTGFLLKPALFATVEAHGARGGFLLLAALPVATLLATLLLVPASAAEPRAPIPLSDTPSRHGHTLSEALRDWRLWLLALSVTAAAFGVGGPLPNMEGVLRAAGDSGSAAVAGAQIIGVAIVCGRIGGGALLDRVWAPMVAAAMLAAGTAGCLAMAHASGGGTLIDLQIFAIAAASGLETDWVAFIVVRYFGLRHFGSIYGVLYGLFVLGTSIGAMTFGALYDASGSYRTALFAFALVLAAAAAAVLLLGPYRYVESRNHAATQT